MSITVNRVVPVTMFEAVHFDGDTSIWDVARWCNAHRVDENTDHVVPQYTLTLRGSGGPLAIKSGDWVVCGINGMYHVVKDLSEFHIVKG